MKVLILYFTKTGHTLEAVSAVAEGIISAGSDVDVVDTKGFRSESISGYDALIVGSPCWAGSVGAPGIAGPVTKALKTLPAGSLAGKLGGAISVNSGVGAERTVQSLGVVLRNMGCASFRPGPTARAGVPLSIIRGPSVTAEDQERFRAFGAEFVRRD
jgi:flavorubredoxin